MEYTLRLPLCNVQKHTLTMNRTKYSQSVNLIQLIVYIHDSFFPLYMENPHYGGNKKISYLNQSWNESRGRICRLLPQLSRHAKASPQQRRRWRQLRSCRPTAGGGRARGRRPPPCSRRWWDCCPGRRCRCASFRNRPDSSGRRLDINNRSFSLPFTLQFK